MGGFQSSAVRVWLRGCVAAWLRMWPVEDARARQNNCENVTTLVVG
jgi:hypothetical protein